MRKIKLSLDPQSIDNAIAELKSYKHETDLKIFEYFQKLGQEAAQQAAQGFSSAVYNGNNDTTVTSLNTDKGSSIIAQGQSAAFIEFGTGQGVSYPGGFPNKPQYPVYDGSYSDAHNGPYAKSGYKYWYYGGKKMTGSKAYMPMLQARSYVLGRYESLAREVFKYD